MLQLVKQEIEEYHSDDPCEGCYFNQDGCCSWDDELTPHTSDQCKYGRNYVWKEIE